MLLVAAGLAFATAAAAAAQTAPTDEPPVTDAARAEAQRQVTQPLNNAPVWKEVRSGVPQFTSIPGRETNVLIQSQGQTWRSLRNGDVSVYGGWALVIVLLAIAAVYWIKGAIELRHPPTGRKVLRFTLMDRTVHWTVPICFVRR